MESKPQIRQGLLWVLILALVALNIFQFLRQDEPAGPGDRPVVDLSPRELADVFQVYFYNDLRTWQQNTWLGVGAQQNPNDAWITQEILHEVKPDFVIEAGAAEGGGAALWATILEQVNPQGRVISIDIVDLLDDARQVPVVQRRVDFLIGSSTAPEIVEDVRRRVAGRPAVVILDSDHRRDHVLAEMHLYAEMVPVGSYMIVQDTNVNGHPVYPDYGPGPMEAVDAFLATNDEFEIDSSRERMMFTFHPRGYLRRVKAPTVAP